MGLLLARLGLAAAAFAVSLLVGEFAVRLVIDPVNYLRPEVVPDPVLKLRVEAGSAGHDAWGFRNAQVPERVDLVAVGDSQTYGNNAPATEAWPHWLGRASGKSVYNLSLGAYGPFEYLHLLWTRAFQLSPEEVIVGFYLGNDLWDAYHSAYTVEHWLEYRDPDRRELWAQEEERVDPTGVAGLNRPPQGSPGVRVRHWLRGRSVLYRLVTVSFGDWVRPLEMKYFYRSRTDMMQLTDADGRLVTTLNPQHRFPGVDLEDARIREGLRLTVVALGAMAEACRRRQVAFAVILIPTKIRVFADRAMQAATPSQAETIEKLVRYESEARDTVAAALAAAGIRYVDVTPALIARGEERLYRRTPDGHPVSRGYEVIGRRAAVVLGLAR